MLRLMLKDVFVAIYELIYTILHSSTLLSFSWGCVEYYFLFFSNLAALPKQCMLGWAPDPCPREGTDGQRKLISE